MKIKQAKDICLAKFPHSLVLFNLKTYRSFILNDTAALLWNFCKTPKDLNKILAIFNSKFQLSFSKIKKDLPRLINELNKRDLIVCK